MTALLLDALVPIFVVLALGYFAGSTAIGISIQSASRLAVAQTIEGCT